MHHFCYSSPLGPITISYGDGICRQLQLGRTTSLPCPDDNPVGQWLDNYFAGMLQPLPAVAPPHTSFQGRLRDALLAIPMGKTVTYGELAGQLDSGARAVGQALGANPLPILIPCHRVVAASGLGGFGSGMAWKKALLAFEGAIAPGNP